MNKTILFILYFGLMLLSNYLVELKELIAQLTLQQLTAISLDKSTIAQHIRHIIEVNYAFIDGLESNLINYEQRARDITLEQDKTKLLTVLQTQIQFFNEIILEERVIQVYVTFANQTTPSAVNREL